MKYTVRQSGRMHNLILPFLFFGLLASSLMVPRWAVAGPAVDCEGSAKAYRLQGIPCDCKNGQIVCDQSSGKSSGSSGKSPHKSSAGSATNAVKQQLFQGVLDAVFLGLQDNASSQEQQEALRRQQMQRAERGQKERAAELERQKNFTETKKQILGSLKGVGADEVGLKAIFDEGTQGSKPVDPTVAQEQDEFERMNAEWMKKQRQLIEQRLLEPNKYAASIYKSLKTNALPQPYKTFAELQPGDVLLFDGKLIAATDNAFSSGSASRASHTVLYLKEINGKKYFLENLPFQGPRIISEETFLRVYGSRDTQVAKLAQPLNKEESQRLFSAAVEMAQKNRKSQMTNMLSTYGPWGKDNIVCSEADWALINATGRNIPKSGDRAKVALGIDYSPADFANSQFFLVTNFMMP